MFIFFNIYREANFAVMKISSKFDFAQKIMKILLKFFHPGQGNVMFVGFFSNRNICAA
jgi:hypothetical protein